jgi:hypothetical protein
MPVLVIPLCVYAVPAYFWVVFSFFGKILERRNLPMWNRSSETRRALFGRAVIEGLLWPKSVIAAF